MKMDQILQGQPLSDADLKIRVPELPSAQKDLTAALLREAMTRLQDAERTMAEQEKRIRELEDLASTDALTGLMNRRGLESFFEQELARIRRGSSEGAVLVLIDLDKFKAINDTLGHQAGDVCLKEVAAQIMKSIRFTDGAARLGGDEFAILLTQTKEGKVTSRVNSIRKALNNVAFKWNEETFKCGGSLGTASVSPDDDGFANAYQAADTALYADKAARKAEARKP